MPFAGSAIMSRLMSMKSDEPTLTLTLLAKLVVLLPCAGRSRFWLVHSIFRELMAAEYNVLPVYNGTRRHIVRE